MQFNFHGDYSQQDKKLFINAQKVDLKKICHYLETDISLVQKICFEIFDTREGKQDADPNHSISRASARFKEMTVYRFWSPKEDPHFPHEITHLVAHTWGKPYILDAELDTWDNKKLKKEIEMISTSFMQEGLAIAVDDIVFDRELMEDGELKLVDKWCKEQLGHMPENLSSVINLDGFGSYPNKIVVPFAASFSKFLLKNEGVEKYKKMYVQIKEILSPHKNVEVIEGVYMQTDEELLTAWKYLIPKSTK